MLQPDTACKLKVASRATFIIVKAHREEEEEEEPLCNGEQGAYSLGSGRLGLIRVWILSSVRIWDI